MTVEAEDLVDQDERHAARHYLFVDYQYLVDTAPRAVCLEGPLGLVRQADYSP